MIRKRTVVLFLSPILAMPWTSARAGGPENAFGWEWLIKPVELPAAEKLRDGIHELSADGILLVDTPSDGSLRVRLVTVGGWQRQGLDEEYQAVAFDVNGSRRAPDESGSSSAGRTVLNEYRFVATDTAAKKRIASVGIEALRPSGRKKIADLAQQRAKAAGMEVLPFPAVGTPFSFELTSLRGQKLRSAELKGKVVLVDCWATWCTPCVEKMSELKKLYESKHDAGFEIIGINFDQDLERARKAIQARGLSWPHVHVPKDRAVRQLWYEACTVRTLPRLFLIDREGVLRQDLHPHDLIKLVSEALEGKSTQTTSSSPATSSN